MRNIKLFSKILVGLSIIAIISNITAVSSAKADSYYEYWQIESTKKNYSTESAGSWVLVYLGTPAKRSGEYDTVSASLSRSATVSGSIQLSKKSIAGAVDVSLSKEYTVGGSKNSAPLAKGEYIKGYAKQINSVHKVTQRKWISLDGSKYKTGTTATAYVKRPSAVSLRIDYYKDGVKIKSALSQNTEQPIEPIESEYYIIDNETNEVIKLSEEEFHELEEPIEEIEVNEGIENEDFINYDPEEDETLDLELNEDVYREELN